MAQSTAQVVAPLLTLSIKDVQNSKAKIDQWLRNKTNDHLTLDRLETVTRSLPVFGSVFAAVDVVTDLMAITDKGVANADIIDWVNLGVDAIGIAPIAGVGAVIRGTVRPSLFLVREEVRRITKGSVKQLTKQQVSAALAPAVINVLANNLNDQLAGDIEEFANTGMKKLNTILSSVGTWIESVTSTLDQGIKQVVEQAKLYNPEANIKRSIEQGSAVWGNLKNTEYKRAFDNTRYSIENNIKGATKMYLNLGAKGVSWVIPDNYKQVVLNLGTNIRTLGVTAKTKVQGLGDPNTAQSIGWLFSILLMAAKAKKKRTAQIKAQQTTQANAQNPNTKLEKTNQQDQAKNDANKCKNCMGGSGRNITFAMGTEFLTHVDAQLNGLIQDVIQRTYVSNLYQYDDSIFGHRWLTSFTTKIARKTKYDEQQPSSKNYQKGYEYIGIDGRAIALPELKKGQSIYDPVEQYTYTVLSDQLRLIAWGEDEKRFYEKSGEDYRLAYIERKHGYKIALRYDHKLEDQKSILSDVLFKQDDQEIGHLAMQLNSLGIVSDIWMVKNGQLDRVIASYDYDGNQDLVQATNEFGALYCYEYQHHLITRYTDLTNRGMNLKWDGVLPTSKAIEEWADNASLASKLEWDENIRKTYVTDLEGNVTEHFYDIDGYTYRIVYPDNLQEWFFRDEAKNITLHMAKDGTQTTHSYDERGNLLTSTQADGATSYFEYDAQDQLIGMVDAEQGRWFKQYDTQGNLIKEIDPLKRETSYSYNALGLVTSIKDAKGGSKKLEYDAQGNLILYVDCSGKKTHWSYDERGRVQAVENALKQKVEYFYTELTTAPRQPIRHGLPLNAIGQLEKVKHADGSEEHFVHDAEGRLLLYIDPKNQQTRYEYDQAGVILSRTDALNHKLKYQWDRLSRLTRLINENGASYEFFYDLGGRLIKEIDFDDKETVYQYESGTGHLMTSIEVASAYGQDLKDRAVPKDRIQQFIFDSMGRLEQRTAGYGHQGQELEQKLVEEFAFDYMGNITHAKNNQSNLQWFYDAVGNVVKEHHQDFKTNQTAVWKHSYDELHNRVKTIRPDGQKVDWLTYGSGHVLGLTLNGEDVVSFERDALHRETLRHYANGISQEQKYDEVGRLSHQLIINGHEKGYEASSQQVRNNAINETNLLVQRLYQYDRTGELNLIKDTRRGDIHYKYDPVGRLLEATSKLGKETFSFDPASNILDKHNSTGHAQLEQSGVEGKGYGYHRLVSNVVKEYLDQQYQYDAYGQLIKQKSTQGDLNLEWDVFGRLIKSRNHLYTAEYRYDPLGRRIQKQSKHHHTGDEQNIIYGWDGDTLAYESTEQLTKHYIYEKDSFVPLLQAVYTSEIELHQTPDWSDRQYSIYKDPLWKTTQQSKDFNDVWYYHCDHLGTPQEMSDQHGAIIWKAQYRAWGECKPENHVKRDIWDSEIIINNIRFQGQYFDEETGFHYNRYRYYSPYVGRFISKDPIGLLGGFNIYAYAPNPVGWIDPFGLAASTAHGKAWEKASGQELPANMQVHHIIPRALQTKAKALCSSFDLDSADNLIALPDKNHSGNISQGKWFGKTKHQGSHPGYTQSVNLAMRASTYVKVGTPCDKIKAMQNLFRTQLQQGNIPLNVSMSTSQITVAFNEAMKNLARNN